MFCVVNRFPLRVPGMFGVDFRLSIAGLFFTSHAGAHAPKKRGGSERHPPG